MSALSSLRAGLTPPAGMRVPANRPGLDGQAAFFRAAMGQTAEPAKATLARAEPAPVAARVETSKPEVQRVEGEMPSRLLRPGSLLDIRV